MNLAPWRKPRYTPRPRAVCASCGLSAAMFGRINAERMIEMIRNGERIPVVPHSCDLGLEDTLVIAPDPDATVVGRAIVPPPPGSLRRG